MTSPNPSLCECCAASLKPALLIMSLTAHPIKSKSATDGPLTAGSLPHAARKKYDAGYEPLSSGCKSLLCLAQPCTGIGCRLTCAAFQSAHSMSSENQP